MTIFSFFPKRGKRLMFLLLLLLFLWILLAVKGIYLFILRSFILGDPRDDPASSIHVKNVQNNLVVYTRGC